MIRHAQVLCFLAAFALLLWVIGMSLRIDESEQEYQARRRREQLARQDAHLKAVIDKYQRRENAKRAGMTITQLNDEAGCERTA